MRCRIIFYLFIFLNVIVYEDYTHTHTQSNCVWRLYTHTHTHMYKVKWNVKKGILKFSNFSSYVISIITWEYLLLFMN